MRITPWLRGPRARICLVVGLGLGVLGLAARQLRHSEVRAARFYETGASLNTLLGEYCRSVQGAVATQDGTDLATFFSDPVELSAADWRAAGEEASVSRQDLAPSPPRTMAASAAARLQRLEASQLPESGGAKCKIDLITDVTDSRVELGVRVRRRGGRGGRAWDEQRLEAWSVERGGERGWRIRRLEPVRGERVVAASAGFERPEPGALGIDFAHRRDPHLDPRGDGAGLRFQVIQHAFGGVAAADYDGDGWDDLFFSDGISSRLLRNHGPGPDGRPRFDDVTASAGLEGIDRATVGLFADVDGDGDLDLFVGRYLAEDRLFLNLGQGRFSEAGAELWLTRAAPTTAATFFDADGDGDLDLYLGHYGDARATFPRIPFFARNAPPNRLLRNDGPAGFVDVTVESGTGDTGWTLAVAAADYDADGDVDLAVANDFGRKVLYVNDGRGHFRDVAREAGTLDFSGGMGLAFGDADGDGRLDLYTSNIQSNQRWYGEELTLQQYGRNLLRSRWAFADFGEYLALYRLLGPGWRQLGLDIGEGNSLLLNQGDGRFREQDEAGVNRAGWGWGVAFLDLDNDGDQDLYAANGWISNRPGSDL